uniref:Aminotransferase-like plant mobile domain-containing protein n=1 Tax=Fagus sylvatica TaxID=28930 RepID=A0A2N9JA03_FAGSY
MAEMAAILIHVLLRKVLATDHWTSGVSLPSRGDVVAIPKFLRTDTGTIVAGSVDYESIDGSRFSPVPEDDREDFVFPLLDPWYDNGGNFPYIPNKVSLPPSNWEWMLRGQEATADQVWVPPLFSISDLKIQRGDMQPVPIDFEFPCSAAADWFHWVADEFLDVKFCALLERAGVAEAILLSRSCNMYRDTEMLRQILWRKRPWWKQALMARSSTRINAWSLYFTKGTDPAVRRAAFVAYWLCKCVFGDAPYYSMKPLYFRLAVKISFGHHFPLAAMFLGYLYLQLDSICLDEIYGGSCHFITTCFNTSALQTFLWERSLNYQEVGNDNSQIREKFRNMSRHILSRYPDLKDQSAARLSLGFSCHSVLYWFSDIASQSFELFPDDTRSLTYLSAVNPGWLPVWSDKGVEYTHYCANRVRRQFGLDQGVPGSPSETLPRTPSIAPFLNDRTFDYWSQSVSRMVIPRGGRLGICTVAMQEYWLRVAVAMADYVNQGRGTRNLGFAEWDGPRDGWILYSTKFPSGWKESVKVVEERLRLDSKRGKGGKKVDSSKGDSSPAASKQKPKSAAKTTSKRPKVAMDMSMIPPSELGGRSLMAPGTSKKSAVGTSKAQKKPAVGSLGKPAEDTSIPSKETESSAVRKKSAPSSTKTKSQPGSKNVAASKKAKGKPTQKSAAAPPSSGEESPVESATPIEKESAVPTPPSTMYGRTRSKRKAAEEQVKSQAKRKVGDEAEGSDWTPIVIEEVSGDDDIVDAGVGTTEDSPIDWSDSDDAMADETLGVTVSDEAVLVMADEAVQSTTSIMAEEVPGEIPVSMADVVRVDEAHEITPVMADEALAGSAAKDDHDQDAGSVDSEETISDEPQPLQIIPFVDQRDEPRTIDPIEFHSNPPFARMASVMEGISLFGVAPRFERIFREESSPMVVSDRPSSGIFIGGQVPALEGTPIQDADDGGMADTEVRGVDVVPEDTSSLEKESVVHVVSAAASSSSDVGLTAKFGDFTTHFKFGAGFGGPMLSLLGSVLADMRRTSFKTLSEPKIFSWRSVVQDLIAVGFDLDFMLEHLRKVARKFFGEAIASEIKTVQEQISSLQSTLAVLVSYQGELMSAAAVSPEVVEVASPIDGLFD